MGNQVMFDLIPVGYASTWIDKWREKDSYGQCGTSEGTAFLSEGAPASCRMQDGVGKHTSVCVYVALD